MKLIAIKTKDSVYISDNIDNSGYYSSALGNLLFDGVKPETTYNRTWFKLPGIPKTIQKLNKGGRVNRRFTLKDGFPETAKTPQLITWQQWNAEDDDGDYTLFTDVRGLYEEQYEMSEDELVDVEFSLNIIEELEEFTMTATKYVMTYNFIDMLNTNPVLLPLKPCSLDAQQSYNIIRAYVKTHIDPRWAKITSDYDFCFTVKKVIALTEAEEYAVDINNLGFGKKRKPKYETRYRKTRETEVYEVAPKSYQSYSIVQPFAGKDYEALQSNIQAFLEDLMKTINAPLIDCPHCNGSGIVQC